MTMNGNKGSKGTNGHTTLVYRVLQPDEWPRLEPEFQRRGWILPYKELAECVIAETPDGKLAGFQLMQIVMHAEPAGVAEGFEGHVNFLRLHGILAELIRSRGIFPGYLVIATDELQKGLLRHAGFEPIPGEIWRKKLVEDTRESDNAKFVQGTAGSV